MIKVELESKHQMNIKTWIFLRWTVQYLSCTRSPVICSTFVWGLSYKQTASHLFLHNTNATSECQYTVPPIPISRCTYDNQYLSNRTEKLLKQSCRLQFINKNKECGTIECEVVNNTPICFAIELVPIDLCWMHLNTLREAQPNRTHVHIYACQLGSTRHIHIYRIATLQIDYRHVVHSFKRWSVARPAHRRRTPGARCLSSTDTLFS